ncbi:adenine deaminase [Acetobacter persici]|uniref:adenine deaminase n=1 Tax=Acetobacter persici TaxID=1076596 RepID=UPI0039EA49C5
MVDVTCSLAEPELRRRAVDAACGRAPFDILLCNGRVADVATGELRYADVGLVGPLIASMHPAGERQDATKQFDLKGAILAPGLIDSHVHIESSMVTPRIYAQTVVPQGTTTICWDPHEIGNVSGLPGVRWAIEASKGLPLRILVEAPSCVPSAPGLERSGADFDATAMAEMLSWPEIIGVAEVMDMRGVVNNAPRMRAIVNAGLKSGKLVCGHARNLAGKNLQAFMAAGIESDHELTSKTDILEKLRSGMTLELRVSHENILPEAVAAFEELGTVPQTVTLCTDDVFPDDLLRRGGMVHHLRCLVALGMNPLDVLRCATLNTAQRLERRDLGLVAAGRRADLVVFDNLTDFTPLEVFASGVHVASRGTLLTTLPPELPGMPVNTVKRTPVTSSDFKIPHTEKSKVKIRTVSTPRTTHWGEREIDLEDGYLILPPDTALMAVFNRYGDNSPPGLGVLEGWGDWSATIGTTILHDSHNLAVFGRDPDEMARVANTLIASGGGMAVAKADKHLVQVELPVCGLLSPENLEIVSKHFTDVRDAAATATTWNGPTSMIKLVTGASLACNPGPHVTDLGIADGMTGDVFSTMVLGDA